uniref:Universal stress protein A-like protein isoform X1 n=1 Tax=Rhizophora mucronata TaxID=61149 RepID=A0A2P2M1B5_RHIMU
MAGSEAQEKEVMVVAIDESDHSMYALEWAVDHFFAPFAPNYPFKLLLLHAKSTASSIVGLAGPGSLTFFPTKPTFSLFSSLFRLRFKNCILFASLILWLGFSFSFFFGGSKNS